MGEHGHGPAHHDASDDELAPDEPRTPMWLPLLGLALFALAVGVMVAGQVEESAAPGLQGAPAAAEGAADGDAAEAPGGDHPPHPGHEAH